MGRKKRRLKVIWEQVPSPEAEERILEAFKLILGPEPRRDGAELKREREVRSRQLKLFGEDKR